MKKTLALIMALTMILALCACGQKAAEPATPVEPAAPAGPAAEGKVLIGAIYRDLTMAWFDKESAAAQKTADELGIDILIGDGHEDPATIIDVLDNFITQGIQGLVINTCDQGISQIIVDKCAEANIPVCAVDIPLVDGNNNYIAPAVELDSYLCGTQTAEWLVNTIEANGGIADPAKTGYLILAMDTATSCIPRGDGQFDYWTEKYPEFPSENIFRVDYNGDTDTGYNAAAATITAHPEIETWYVVGSNDDGVVGAARFLEEVGLDKNAVCVGIDGYMASDEFKKDFSPVKASAYLQASTVAEVSVTAVYENIVNGTEIFGEYKKDGAQFGVYPFGSVIVTPENYRDIMGDDAG